MNNFWDEVKDYITEVEREYKKAMHKKDESDIYSKKVDEPHEEWAAIVRVYARPGWDGKMTWKKLVDTVAEQEDPGRTVQLCKVDNGRKLAVTYLERD